MWFWPRRADNQGRQAPSDSRQQQGSSAAVQAGQAPLTREVAGVASELGGALAQFGGAAVARDPLLGSGSHASGVPAPDTAYDYPYGLFEEALDKDAHLQALIGQRKAAVLSWERSLVAADESAAAQAALGLVHLGLDNLGGVGGRQYAVGSRNGGDSASLPAAYGQQPTSSFDRDLWELLDALPFGIAVSEVVWEWVEAGSTQYAVGSKNEGPGFSASLPTASRQLPTLPPGRYLLPKALLSRHPRRFVFSPQGELRLLTAAEPVDGEPVPARKFIVFAPYGRHEHPYGTPLLRSVWWASWFKRQALKFWLLHCEKYGMPTAVLTHPASATERERKAFRSVVGSIQQETGLVLPEGVELSLLEASRSGGPAAYQALIELCNSEMSKAILGQTLTVDTPQGSGAHASLAMARVHEHVRQDITRLDAQALMGCINSTLVRWIVELNQGGQGLGFRGQVLGEGKRHKAQGASKEQIPALTPDPYHLTPSWVLSPPARDDLRLQLEIDRFFAEQGLAVDSGELYARYGRGQKEAVSGRL